MSRTYNIMPCLPEHLDACVRIALEAEAAVQDNALQKLGSELYSVFMGQWQKQTEEQIRQLQKDQQMYVALEEEQVAGFGACQCYGTMGIISACYTAPECPDAAALLYQSLLARLKERGAVIAQISCGTEPVYAPRLDALKKAGFEKSLPHVLYHRVLGQPAALPETKLQIVPCCEDHIPDCVSIAGKLWTGIHEGYAKLLGQDLHRLGWPDWRKNHAASIAARQRTDSAFVALLDGQVVGFCSYRVDGEAAGVISYNGVDPVFRGRGIARYMYEHAFNEMRRRGIRYVRVHTGGDDGHAPARRAYEKAGFDKFLLSATYYKALYCLPSLC